MGLSSMPTPSEGVLILLVANTAVSIEILKQLISSVLAVLGIRALIRSDHPASEPVPDLALSDRFRARFKPVRFGRRKNFHLDCRVCLGRFEQESVVNRLTCGHVFHHGCLERWMVEYRHATCPLCRSRTHLLDDEGSAGCELLMSE